MKPQLTPSSLSYVELAEKNRKLEAALEKRDRTIWELGLSEEKFRHFFEKSPIMIYVTDVDGTFLNVNAAGAELMGFDAVDEVIGLRAQDFFFVDKGDRATYLEILRREGKISNFETRMRRKNGTTIHAQMTAALRTTVTGKLKGYEGFVINITPRKKFEKELRASEEKYRTVLESSLAAIYMFQDGGIFSYVNSQYVEMLGYDTPEEILGTYFWEAVHPEDRPFVKERGLQRELEDIHPRRYVFRLLKKNGGFIWADMQAMHASYMGRPAVVGNFIDITRERQAEEEIRLLSRKLIDGIEEERRTLAADLHDEFGQSLMLLQLDTEALLQTLPESMGDSRGMCEKVMDQIQRLAECIRDTSSRLRPDMLDHLGLIPTLKWYVQDFNQRVSGIQVDLQAAGFKRRLNTETEIVLFRIFQEGLNNVTRHAAASHVKIHLTYSHPRVIFMLRDNGCGFNPEADRLLESNATHGIGLLSMKERVAALMGDFDIKSAPEKGTLIRVELPIHGKRHRWK